MRFTEIAVHHQTFREFVSKLHFYCSRATRRRDYTRHHYKTIKHGFSSSQNYIFLYSFFSLYFFFVCYLNFFTTIRSARALSLNEIPRQKYIHYTVHSFFFFFLITVPTIAGVRGERVKQNANLTSVQESDFKFRFDLIRLPIPKLRKLGF